MQVQEVDSNRISVDEKNTAEGSLEARQWESNHLLILLLGVIGVGGLAAVMGAIFILAPFLARV